MFKMQRSQKAIFRVHNDRILIGDSYKVLFLSQLLNSFSQKRTIRSHFYYLEQTSSHKSLPFDVLSLVYVKVFSVLFYQEERAVQS